ncbi:hypothetical protein EDM53_03465 [Rickettsiales endosymbiont of Peranema trichophorum]|uniref:hypothetical protein n=1 Tax=Rickettsiales endosymbiont of Peranema trichophorum TaxID=2486577 RepID=UPI0010DECD27|nr:hypothetical protein [Rickettsiales endosymbiont of Peranema trichophorum]RZI46971.1 hypothetical protein EDM53_03465 [Rickettsiales endosymbiont of Peranema trichophorum]
MSHQHCGEGLNVVLSSKLRSLPSKGDPFLDEGLNLNLSNNDINDTVLKEAVSLMRDKVRSLSVLDLSGNRITEEGIHHIGGLLQQDAQQNGGLTHLYLQRNLIGELGAISLAVALCGNRALKHLDLSDNRIGSEGAKTIIEAVSHIPSVEGLVLRSNRIGQEIAELLVALLKDSNLATLDLRDNQVGDNVVSILAKKEFSNTALRYLDLSKNDIRGESIQAIATMLVDYTLSLEQLKLSSNKIGDDGAYFLSPILRYKTSLKRLELDDNQIGDPGIEALVDALKKSTPGASTALTHLSLQHNKIGNDGFIRLMRVLEQDSALLHLDMSFNHININETEVCAVEALGKMIKGNRTIREIYLDGNKFDEDMVMRTSQYRLDISKQITEQDTLPHYIEQNTNLLVFHISHQRAESMKVVNAILARNKFVDTIKQGGLDVSVPDKLVGEIIEKVEKRYEECPELLPEEPKRIEEFKKKWIEVGTEEALERLRREKYEKMKEEQKLFQKEVHYHNELFNRRDLLDVLKTASQYGGGEAVDIVIRICANTFTYEVFSDVIKAWTVEKALEFVLDVYQRYGDDMVERVIPQCLCDWHDTNFINLWKVAKEYQVDVASKVLVAVYAMHEQFLTLHGSIHLLSPTWELSNTFKLIADALVLRDDADIRGILDRAYLDKDYGALIGKSVKNHDEVVAAYAVLGEEVFKQEVYFKNAKSQQIEKLIMYFSQKTGEIVESRIECSNKVVLHLNTARTLEGQFHDLIAKTFTLTEETKGNVITEASVLVDRLAQSTLPGAESDKEIGMMMALLDLLGYLDHNSGAPLWPFRPVPNQNPPYDDGGDQGGAGEQAHNAPDPGAGFGAPDYGANGTWGY